MARGGARPGAGAPRGDRNGQRKKKLLTKIEVPKIDAPGIVDKPPVADKPRELAPPPPPVAPIAGVDDAPVATLQPLDYFLAIMRDPAQPADRRDRAAAVILSFCHAKPGEKGKKGEREEKAAAAASGRFAAPAPPRLVAGGKS